MDIASVADLKPDGLCSSTPLVSDMNMNRKDLRCPMALNIYLIFAFMEFSFYLVLFTQEPMTSILKSSHLKKFPSQN